LHSGASRFAAKRKSRTTARSAEAAAGEEAVEAVGGVVESPRGAIARGAARYYAGREGSAPAAARSEVELESSLDLMEMGGADDLDDDLGA